MAINNVYFPLDEKTNIKWKKGSNQSLFYGNQLKAKYSIIHYS